MSNGDTIYALSSGAGRVALAVVRVSGARAWELISALTGRETLEPRKLVLHTLRVPGSGEAIDQAVVVWLPGPGSYTGEDAAEFHVHGSEAIISALFAVLRGWPGVRQAVAGEFTRRAVANGKMDLVEAEGLGDLLVARTSIQRRQALGQFLGDASSIFDSWRERLLFIRADIEAVVDFVDEEGVAYVAGERIRRQIAELLTDLEGALSREKVARAIRSGMKVVLAGLPNTGKSSLLNVLAQRDAALVSAIPGTTRDVIEVALDMNGVAVLLTDTAGLRPETEDEVEFAGMAKARNEVEHADVKIWVIAPDISGCEEIPGGVEPDIVVCNKMDLIQGAINHSRLLRNGSTRPEIIFVSAKTGEGVGKLIVLLSSLAAERFKNTEGAIVVTERQREIVEQSIRFLNESLRFQDDALELMAEEVRLAADAIGRLTGRTEVEEWLGAIFSRFCIGK